MNFGLSGLFSSQRSPFILSRPVKARRALEVTQLLGSATEQEILDPVLADIGKVRHRREAVDDSRRTFSECSRNPYPDQAAARGRQSLPVTCTDSNLIHTSSTVRPPRQPRQRRCRRHSAMVRVM
jgi:hypothetical protein